MGAGRKPAPFIKWRGVTALANVTKSQTIRPIGKKGSWGEIVARDFRINWAVYVMALPVLAYFIIFNYIPMTGIIMAFQKFQIKKGIWGSKFVGLANFVRFFNSPYAWRTIRNTLLISIYGLAFSFPLPVVFALCLNEVRSTRFKRVTQTISYLPYFISIVVVVAILFDFCKSEGVLTLLAKKFGWSGGALISSPKWFRTLYIGSNLWQHLGYNSIIFISALAAIDPQLYEAATIDGANRWQQFKAIILPGIKTVFMLNLILSITGSLSAFEPAYVVGSMGANGTATFFIKIHQMAHVSQKVGQACAMAMVLMALILLFTAAQRLFFRYVMKDSESTFNAKANKAKALW